MQAGPHKLRTARAIAVAVCMLVAGLLLPAKGSAQLPGPGMFLVATDEVRGDFFRETVVLLLYYADDGAQGLVINRPMQASPAEILPDLDGIDDYEGMLYWGGPVQIISVRALLRTDDPPPDSVRILDGVYLIPPDRGIPSGASDASDLRYFLGYAGWAPGQLDGELLDENWHIVPATSELLFDADTGGLWHRLNRPEAIRASLPQSFEHSANIAQRTGLSMSATAILRDY